MKKEFTKMSRRLVVAVIMGLAFFGSVLHLQSQTMYASFYNYSVVGSMNNVILNSGENK
jgi:hypothetical protein